MSWRQQHHDQHDSASQEPQTARLWSWGQWSSSHSGSSTVSSTITLTSGCAQPSPPDHGDHQVTQDESHQQQQQLREWCHSATKLRSSPTDSYSLLQSTGQSIREANRGKYFVAFNNIHEISCRRIFFYVINPEDKKNQSLCWSMLHFLPDIKVSLFDNDTGESREYDIEICLFAEHQHCGINNSD